MMDVGDTMSTIGECSVHLGDTMSTLGDTMSTSGDILSTSGGYHEQVDKSLSISIENPDVLNIPRCTHDIPPMYSWNPPDVLMISLQCTHDIPSIYSWYPPMY